MGSSQVRKVFIFTKISWQTFNSLCVVNGSATPVTRQLYKFLPFFQVSSVTTESIQARSIMHSSNKTTGLALEDMGWIYVNKLKEVSEQRQCQDNIVLTST